MINETLYNKTVDILVQAYFNDELESTSCTQCAVGNIVAANFGSCSITGWSNVFLTTSVGQQFWLSGYTGIAKEEIDSTGYCVNDLAKIEYAFETATRTGCNFKGLMAVIDVLDIIHENKDTVTSKAVKQRFVKQSV